MAEPDISYAGDNVAPFLVADAGPAANYPVGPRGQPIITVRKPKSPPPAADKPPSEGTGSKNSVEDLPAYVAPEDKAAPPGQRQSVEDLPAYQDTSVPSQPEREVGFGASAAAGARSGLTLGFDPALQGVKAAAHAGEPEGGTFASKLVEGVARAANPFAPVADLLGLPQNHEIVQGLTRIIMNSDGARDAYAKGRDTAQETQDLAAKQQPWAYYPGLIAGSLAVPVPGMQGGALAVDAVRAARAVEAARAAGASKVAVEALAAEAKQAANVARVAQVSKAATTGGALSGTEAMGEATSHGQSLPDILAAGARAVPFGVATGGAFGAVLPRAAPAASAVQSSGQRAQQTATDLLKTPLGRGLASDNRYVRGTTAKLRGFPLAGEDITENVHKVQKAAGQHIEDIAGGMTGGADSRAAADTVARAGLKDVIKENKQTIRDGYNDVRARIDEDARYTMPKTKAALDEVERSRAIAGHEDPKLGLDQARNVSEGTTFEGAQRAREETRNAGGPLNPHPGFNAEDFNKIERAMSDDLRGIVRAAAQGGAPEKKAAVDAFEKAEKEFGPLKELNDRLTDMVYGQGEGSIAKLLGAAKEKGGDVRLLAQLQRTMPKEAFEHIGGQVLHELGGSGEFSMNKFADGWDKISDRAKDILFSPQHRKDIDDIVHLGGHIKKSLEESSTSHSANLLVLLEIAGHAAGIVSDVYHGTAGLGTAASVVAPAAGYTLTKWLANPAVASSMSAWSKAYRAATLGAPTPARIAAFKIASRNLAHNLNIPVEDVMRTIQNHLPAAAQPSSDNERPEVPGPR